MSYRITLDSDVSNFLLYVTMLKLLLFPLIIYFKPAYKGGFVFASSRSEKYVSMKTKKFLPVIVFYVKLRCIL